jgi:hypothetical protein
LFGRTNILKNPYPANKKNDLARAIDDILFTLKFFKLKKNLCAERYTGIFSEFGFAPVGKANNLNSNFVSSNKFIHETV